jgi:hypothetical protein
MARASMGPVDRQNLYVDTKAVRIPSDGRIRPSNDGAALDESAVHREKMTRFKEKPHAKYSGQPEGSLRR